jgi:hypothetical protein
MTSRKYVIVGTTKSGLRLTHFSPCNLLQSAKYPFGKTVVLVLRILKSEHVLASQSSSTVDLLTLTMFREQRLRYVLFSCLPHALPDLLDLSTHALFPINGFD